MPKLMLYGIIQVMMMGGTLLGTIVGIGYRHMLVGILVGMLGGTFIGFMVGQEVVKRYQARKVEAETKIASHESS